MKKSKHFGVVLGSILVLVAVGLLIRYCRHLPSSEITRVELNRLIQENQITDATVTPTPYQGIYVIEGSSKSANQTKHFSITTHLETQQIEKILKPATVKIEMPGQGTRGQWINIISMVLICGLVVWVVVHQGNIGKGKGTHKIRARPEVRF